MKKLFGFFLTATLLFPRPTFAADWELPQYESTPSASPVTSTTPFVCTDLSVLSGQDTTAPSRVTFETTANTGTKKVSKYRYHFGDGTVLDAGSQVTHEYKQGGTYEAYVEIEDLNGRFVTSAGCREQVRLKTAVLVTHKSECTELSILSGKEASAPAVLTFQLSGFDNEATISGYRMRFGDGKISEQANGIFEHTYAKAGSYAARGEVKDGKGTWKTSDKCTVTAKVGTVPLSSQPETGAPLLAWVLIGSSGVLGIYFRKKALE